MPEISRFFGIIIYMYAADHAPPHFHAKYGDDEAVIDIASGEVLKGYLSRRTLRLVQDWAELHQLELYRNFEFLQQENATYVKIEPLS